MVNLLLLLGLVVVLAGVLGFSGAAGVLTWPLLGIFWIALLFLLTILLLVAAGGEEIFR